MLLVILFRAFLLAILLYYVVKAVRNLIAAVRDDPKARRHVPPHAPRQEAPPPSWQDHRTPAPRQPTSQRDVEDARWTDLS